MIEDLDRLSTQRYVSQGYKALIYAGLGKTEPAFEWLQRAYGEGSEWLMYLDIDRRYNTLRADPRFDDLLRHLGLGRRAAGPA